MDKIGDEIASRLSVEMNSWRSIEIEVRDDFKNVSGSSDPNSYSGAIYREHYIETISGQRLGEFLETPTDKPEKFSDYYHDGTKGADVSHKAGKGTPQTYISIKKNYKYEGNVPWNMRPFPLRYFYLSKVPLYESLKNAEHLGEESCLGRTCERFLFRRAIAGAYPCDMVYSIDRETGIPLKLEAFNGLDGFTQGIPSSIWRALSLDQVEGRHFPLRSEEIVFLPRLTSDQKKSVDPKPKVAFQTTSVVEAIHFDRDYPASIFWPKIEASATVVDTIAKTTIRPTISQASKAVAPIRVEQGIDWGNTLPWVGSGLGITVIMVGIIARYRQR